MDLEYAHKKLYSAIRALVLMEEPLQKRIGSGWVCEGILEVNLDDIPVNLQTQLSSIQKELMRIRPISGEGLEEMMLIMSLKEAEIIAEKIVDLYDEVTILLGAEENERKNR